MEFKIQRPSWYIDDATVTATEAPASFAVTAQLQATANGTLSDYAKLEFNYQGDTSLKSFFNNRVYRYPPTGSLTGAECAGPGWGHLRHPGSLRAFVCHLLRVRPHHQRRRV